MFNNPGDVIGVIYANQNQNQKNSDTKKRYRSQRSGQSATEIMGNARFVDFSLVHAGTKNDDISLSAASTSSLFFKKTLFLAVLHSHSLNMLMFLVNSHTLLTDCITEETKPG